MSRAPESLRTTGSVGQRYPILPIPWIPAQTELIAAGAVTIGVGYRVLNEAISKEYLDRVGYVRANSDGSERTYQGEDAGVCLHVLGPDRSGELVEYLRLDCFDDEPHYHYVYNDLNAQDRVFLDPTVEGDPMEWALERIRTRLPDVLRKVGAAALAEQIDQNEIERALIDVRAAIERAHQLVAVSR